MNQAPQIQVEYNLRTPTQIILVTIYSKLVQADISAEQIRRILKEFEDESKPFAVDSTMTVLEFGYNEFHEAVMAHVKQGKEEAWVPLADLKVTPKSDQNYWPVREYAVWFGNR